MPPTDKPESEIISERTLKSTAHDPRFQRFVVGVMAGKNMSQAARDAGYSKSTAQNAYRELMPNARKLFGAMLDAAIPLQKQVSLIAEGMEAHETKFFADKGIVKDERTVENWGARHDFVKLAAQIKGLVPERVEFTGEDGQPFQVQVIIASVSGNDFEGVS